MVRLVKNRDSLDTAACTRFLRARLGTGASSSRAGNGLHSIGRMRISDKLALARSPSMNATVTVCLPALANDNNPNGYRSAAPSPCGKPRTAASPPAPRGHPRMPGRRRQAVRRRAGSLRWQPANPAPHQWARTAMCTRSTGSIRSYRAPRFRWVPWGLSQRPETSGPLARSPPARSTHPCRHAAP